MQHAVDQGIHFQDSALIVGILGRPVARKPQDPCTWIAVKRVVPALYPSSWRRPSQRFGLRAGAGFVSWGLSELSQGSTALSSQLARTLELHPLVADAPAHTLDDEDAVSLCTNLSQLGSKRFGCSGSSASVTFTSSTFSTRFQWLLNPAAA